MNCTKSGKSNQKNTSICESCGEEITENIQEYETKKIESGNPETTIKASKKRLLKTYLFN